MSIALHIQSGDCGLSVYGLDSRFDQAAFEQFMSLALPGFELSDKEQSHQMYVMSGSNSIVFDYESRVYAYRSQSRIGAFEIGWPMLTIFERQRQSRAQYTLHASAFAANGRGVLILGESGAGKTLLLLAAVLHRGWSAIGADQTVVSDDTILVGTTSTLFAPWHATQVPEITSHLTTSPEGPWGQRGALDLATVGTVNEQSPLSLVVVPSIAANQPIEEFEWSHRKKCHYAYQAAGQLINGLNVGAFDRSAAIPQLDTQNLRDRRIVWAKTLTESVPLLVLKGGAAPILDRIEHELNG